MYRNAQHLATTQNTQQYDGCDRAQDILPASLDLLSSVADSDDSVTLQLPTEDCLESIETTVAGFDAAIVKYYVGTLTDQYNAS
ncbi:hypothetical protein ACOMHN_028808 [Nucella lapillus]